MASHPYQGMAAIKLMPIGNNSNKPTTIKTILFLKKAGIVSCTSLPIRISRLIDKDSKNAMAYTAAMEKAAKMTKGQKLMADCIVRKMANAVADR